MIQNNWKKIQSYALKIGFSSIGCSDMDLSLYIPHYRSWIEKNFNADLDYMTKHGNKRLYPELLIPGTKRILVVSINYLHNEYTLKDWKRSIEKKSKKATISEYALGRDYHKVVKKKLQKLADYITSIYPEHQYRVFADSAPVLEKPLAEKAGLGVIGKNSNLLNLENGSFFFLGTLFTNINFPIGSQNTTDICGKCTACIKVCPTNAIVAPKVIDANKCISYLTIENKKSIPLEYRKLIGNRIYGCDDCQLICPININAPLSKEADFKPRQELINQDLINLFEWSEQKFLKTTEGSAIRRIGYNAWRRNIAIALGNASYDKKIIAILKIHLLKENNEIVKESIQWAIENHGI